MKLKGTVGHQAAVFFDHSTTFVFFPLYLSIIISSMCVSMAVCVRGCSREASTSESFIFLLSSAQSPVITLQTTDL